MLSAFFDRSELPRQGVVAIGGFLGPAEYWVRVQDEWSAVLRQHGVTCFHMTDFENRQGEFRGWSNPRRESVIKQLIGILKRNTFLLVGTGLLLSHYSSFSKEDQRMLGHPYAISAKIATALMFRWMEKAAKTLGSEFANVPVGFFFELGDEGAGELAQVFQSEQASGPLRNRIVSISFERKCNFAGLQAADIAAYEVAKQLIRSIGVDTRPIRKSLQGILRGIPAETRYLHRRSLSHLLAAYRPS